MLIALALPVYKPDLTPDEQTSLRHLQRYLGGFPKIAVQPAGLGLRLPNFEVREFPAHHFATISAYSKLLLSPAFYETFDEYDYILLYQTDCLVFSSILLDFCKLAYDYIGAPLFKKDSQPPRLSRVGNGGLSLRRVQAFLDVLNSDDIPAWSEVFRASLLDLYKFPRPRRWLKRWRVIRDARRGVGWYAANYSLNEDLFWSDRARLFKPDFKIAPLDQALQFAFDTYPRICFARNGNKLPFGAHAWAKWDRDFWQPHLLA
ncbi:MAG: hypothetical protein DCC59_06095 [Chloroflexi bacterium]|nr:MAG: hypothetical protein DCC59_06095 [Chloroflexota bacterium]